MQNQTLTTSRIGSIDTLRGIAIIFMILDHTRDFLHADAVQGQNPLDLTSLDHLTFLTRWLTHFCAPVFVFLSGTSIFLTKAKNSSTKAAAMTLVKRGLWFMLADLSLISFLWFFRGDLIWMQVIWAIGISMVVMAACLYIPDWTVLLIGTIILFGHNLLDHVKMSGTSIVSLFWYILHQPKKIQLPGLTINVIYPFLPWCGLMMVGYAFGRVVLRAEKVKSEWKWVLASGIIASALFVTLRFWNRYGDPHAWSLQITDSKTIFDFVKVSKYPPSLLYLLMTIGPALILLWAIQKVKPRLLRPLEVFGSVPFFVYVLHIFLLHIVCLVLFYLSGYPPARLYTNGDSFAGMPKEFGFSLLAVYFFWMVTLAVLYKPSAWYQAHKRKHRLWWHKYI